jgi:hypothetical protein
MPGKLPFPRKAPPPTTMTMQDGAWQVGPVPLVGSYGS